MLGQPARPARVYPGSATKTNACGIAFQAMVGIGALPVPPAHRRANTGHTSNTRLSGLVHAVYCYLGSSTHMYYLIQRGTNNTGYYGQYFG